MADDQLEQNIERLIDALNQLDAEKRRQILDALKANCQNLVGDFERIFSREPEITEPPPVRLPPPPRDRKKGLRRAMKITTVLSRHSIWNKRFK